MVKYLVEFALVIALVIISPTITELVQGAVNEGSAAAQGGCYATKANSPPLFIPDGTQFNALPQFTAPTTICSSAVTSASSLTGVAPYDGYTATWSPSEAESSKGFSLLDLFFDFLRLILPYSTWPIALVLVFRMIMRAYRTSQQGGSPF